MVLLGVEVGGTTVVIVFANPGNFDVSHPDFLRAEIKTGHPGETFSTCFKVIDEYLSDKDVKITGIGIASFGPVDLRANSSTYGFITTTPKPNWGMTDVVGAFKAKYANVPIRIETDVNAAALAEMHSGGHLVRLKQNELGSLAYATVGTGIGVGAYLESRPIHGLLHPEAGHMYPPLHALDLESKFNGVCPFHGACIEGLTCASAIAARLKLKPSQLASVADEDPVWDIVAYYLAHLCVNITLLLSVECIVLGGGVLQRKTLFPRICTHFTTLMNNYLSSDRVTKDVSDYIVPSVLNNSGMMGSGALGALLLAEQVSTAE